jgi:hypothetical protein
MGVYILDGLNGAVDLVNNYESIIWTVQYYGLNDFQIVVPMDANTLQNFQLGRLLAREEDARANGYTNVMMVEKITITSDIDKGWMMTVTGSGLKSILKRRIIWEQITSSGTVENIIRKVLKDNVTEPDDANRTITDFVLGSAIGFTETTDIQLFGENIGEWLPTICESFGFGWDVEIVNSKYRFKLYKGTDRTYNQSVVAPVVFSPEFDNLLTSEYTYNKADYKNAALIGGEGEGTSQRTASIGTASGMNRYELYVDGSSVSSNGEIITEEQYEELLKSYGREQLTEASYDATFSGDIEPNGLYKINQDYFLGDLVEVENGVGVSATTRITEIIYASDSNGESVVPTFSEMEVV